jgi:hypothetical protein
MTYISYLSTRDNIYIEARDIADILDSKTNPT